MIKTIELQDNYTFYNDPGHGWLKVPAAELGQLGVVNKISGYSYIKDKYVYLEEDCDAGVFLRARFPGLTPREVGAKYIRDYHTDNDSPIRNYSPYRLVDIAKLL